LLLYGILSYSCKNEEETTVQVRTTTMGIE
jgi:hypothetical protein